MKKQKREYPEAFKEQAVSLLRMSARSSLGYLSPLAYEACFREWMMASDYRLCPLN